MREAIRLPSAQIPILIHLKSLTLYYWPLIQWFLPSKIFNYQPPSQIALLFYCHIPLWFDTPLNTYSYCFLTSRYPSQLFPLCFIHDLTHFFALSASPSIVYFVKVSLLLNPPPCLKSFFSGKNFHILFEFHWSLQIYCGVELRADSAVSYPLLRCRYIHQNWRKFQTSRAFVHPFEIFNSSEENRRTTIRLLKNVLWATSRFVSTRLIHRT